MRAFLLRLIVAAVLLNTVRMSRPMAIEAVAQGASPVALQVLYMRARSVPGAMGADGSMTFKAALFDFAAISRFFRPYGFPTPISASHLALGASRHPHLPLTRIS